MRAIRSVPPALSLAAACMAAGAPPADARAPVPVFNRPLCAPAAAGHAQCLARVVTDSAGDPLAAATPAGYGPADLRSAYGLGDPSQAQGSGHTIAVVAAYDSPTAESDLAVYRSQFGLPPCSTANGCFSKRDQRGGALYPAPDRGWGGEMALDLDMASAVCPNCRLILVEASSSSLSDLGAAVDEAASLGATEISNSYGGPEFQAEDQAEAHYNHPGVALTVASGDDGYGVGYPAASRFVTAVGGTTLSRAGNPRGWSETLWAGTGSGCSAYIPKPPWQGDPYCGSRTVADTAAVADPATGVAVFHTDGSNPGASGWLQFGGTSAAAPVVAGLYALKGHGAPADPSRDLSPFFDVVAGANGSCGSYLCQAAPGYDAPTGAGTPQGASSGSTPPSGGSGQAPGASGNPSTPVASAAVAPRVTRKRATRDARKAIARRFRHPKRLRVSCRVRNRLTASCKASWRSGPKAHRCGLTLTYVANPKGLAVQRASYTTKRRTR